MTKHQALQILRHGIDGLGNDGPEYEEIADWLEKALPDEPKAVPSMFPAVDWAESQKNAEGCEICGGPNHDGGAHL